MTEQIEILRNGKMVKEIEANCIDDEIENGKPFVVRGHRALLFCRRILEFESLRTALGDMTISVEHKHRWLQLDRTLTLKAYLDQIEETEFYWRQVKTSSLNLDLAILPTPARVRTGLRFFDQLWVGPRGTIQTFHQDNHDDIIVNHNLFCQIVGKKYVALASPEDSQFFISHPLSSRGLTHHSSASPFESSIVLSCPSFTQTVLEPGDMLYVPPRYWHYLQSFSPSVSVSRWWFGSRIAEILYETSLDEQLDTAKKGLGRAAWLADIAEFGGVDILQRYTDRLSGLKKYALMLRFFREYGEGFQYGSE